MSENQKAFEHILGQPRCVSPASVFDPVSARIASDLGFEVALLAGSSASLQILGAPDLVLVTLSEIAEQTRRITRACSIPVLVDADHGFGNALSVMRTVQELSSAGAAAITVEDTLLPAAFGRAASRELVDIDEAIGKLRAACHAAKASPISIVARTDIAVCGLEEGVLRVKEYARQPVSAIFISGVKTRADLDAISVAAGLPLILGVVPDALQDTSYLAARGVRLFNKGHQPLLASIQAIFDTMAALRNGNGTSGSMRLASEQTVDRLSAGPSYREWTEAFL